jgi:hypothetical protein
MQQEIADELGPTNGAINNGIAQFLANACPPARSTDMPPWSAPILNVWGEDRRALARRYFTGRQPPAKPGFYPSKIKLSPALMRARQGKRTEEFMLLPTPHSRGRIFDPDERFQAACDIWRNVWITYTLSPDGLISMVIER